MRTRPSPSMRPRTADQPALLLAVVLPIRDQTCNFFSFTREKAYQAANESVGDAHDRADGVVSDIVKDNSECTEEEMVAVEQLAHLRHIRDLSMQEGADDCSCFSESSFNTTAAVPSLTSLQNRSHSKGSPAPSSSATCNVVLGDQRHKQEQKNYVFQFQSSRGTRDEDVGEACKEQNEAISSQSVRTHLACVNEDDIDVDDDGRRVPRSRLLSEIYQDQLSEMQHIKVNKRRRKTMNRIMAVDH